jgi:hypothetical protein
MSTEGVSHESAGTTSARLTALGPATLGEAQPSPVTSPSDGEYPGPKAANRRISHD